MNYKQLSMVLTFRYLLYVISIIPVLVATYALIRLPLHNIPIPSIWGCLMYFALGSALGLFIDLYDLRKKADTGKPELYYLLKVLRYAEIICYISVLAQGPMFSTDAIFCKRNIILASLIFLYAVFFIKHYFELAEQSFIEKRKNIYTHLLQDTSDKKLLYDALKNSNDSDIFFVALSKLTYPEDRDVLREISKQGWSEKIRLAAMSKLTYPEEREILQQFVLHDLSFDIRCAALKRLPIDNERETYISFVSYCEGIININNNLQSTNKVADELNTLYHQLQVSKKVKHIDYRELISHTDKHIDEMSEYSHVDFMDHTDYHTDQSETVHTDIWEVEVL